MIVSLKFNGLNEWTGAADIHGSHDCFFVVSVCVCVMVEEKDPSVSMPFFA